MVFTKLVNTHSTNAYLLRTIIIHKSWCIPNKHGISGYVYGFVQLHHRPKERLIRETHSVYVMMHVRWVINTKGQASAMSKHLSLGLSTKSNVGNFIPWPPLCNWSYYKRTDWKIVFQSLFFRDLPQLTASKTVDQCTFAASCHTCVIKVQHKWAYTVMYEANLVCCWSYKSILYTTHI